MTEQTQQLVNDKVLIYILGFEITMSRTRL